MPTISVTIQDALGGQATATIPVNVFSSADVFSRSVQIGRRTKTLLGMPMILGGSGSVGSVISSSTISAPGVPIAQKLPY